MSSRGVGVAAPPCIPILCWAEFVGPSTLLKLDLFGDLNRPANLLCEGSER